MPWFKVDDQTTFHPKVMRAGNAAFGAWVRLGAYCNAQLTDGFIPASVARMIASRRELETLIESQFLDQIEGGYRIHDYLEYQPSRAQVEAERKATRARVTRHRNGVTPGVSTQVSLPLTLGVSTPVPSGSRPVPSRPTSEETLAESADADPAGESGEAAFDAEEAFTKVYELFPRKEGKSKGKKVFEREIASQIGYERFVQSVRNYAAHVAAEGRELKHVKQFDTFMRCWEDYAPGNFEPLPPRPRELSRGQVPVVRDLDYSNGGSK